MSNLEQFSIISEMNQDKEYVENYELETDKGTKRMKEKFYMEACTERNRWIYEKKNAYQEIANSLMQEIQERVPRLMPNDCTEAYNNFSANVDRLLYVVQLSSNTSNSFKLNIDFILASINDLTSLEDLNSKIALFINRFKEFGINLTIEDFKYTMFTEMYMKKFFENSDYDSVKDTFEDIYFKCPDIKLQLKMNLQDIIRKYDKQLATYVELIKNKMYQEYTIPPTGDVVAKYVNARFELGDHMATDEFYNAKLFLDGQKRIDDYMSGSPARDRIYNTFALSGDYNATSEEEKKSFNDAMMGFFLTLNELKKFYHYEFILKELVEFYKDKASAKGAYTTKQKEIDKEEKKRADLYKQYLKACGVGFLAKNSPEKQKLVMLQMNNHIKHLKELYDELNDLEIKYKVSELSDSATIYDLFLTSLTSFPFLEKCFAGEEFEEKTLEENVNEYLKFIYNPNNGFLRKVNGLNDYNITDIVAEKYKLLNINVTSDMITSESIDATFQDVSFINLIQNIERSKITLEQIDNLCKMNEILKQVQFM